MPTVYLGLGANMGRREDTLKRAQDLLRTPVPDLRVSSLYETAPVGFLDQPRFLNAVCTGNTVLAPADLLREVLAIEASLGRVRNQRWGPRTIDIDILFYDDLILETGELVIPHPRLAERAFVLVPLAEIAPGLVHPVFGASVKSLLAALPGAKQDVKIIGHFNRDAG